MESNQTIPITKDYKVLVGCMTYNHSKYIVDALNGFAMQKTNFPFACIVMDDASTDGEPEVIKDWLQKECDMANAKCYDLELANVIIVSHRVNANCTMAIYFLKRNLYNEENLKLGLVQGWTGHCEYIALCEGDDYWTDPEKLQIQADCLDAHPEVDMCSHSFREISAITGEATSTICRRKKDCIVPVEDVIIHDGNYFATNSMFYRAHLENNVPAFRQYLNIDYSLSIHGALRGGIYYINHEMSAYRLNVTNSWSSHFFLDDSFREQYFATKFCMLDIFDKEQNNRFHKYIEAYKIRKSVLFTNTRSVNIINLKTHIDGFGKLTPFQRIKILCKCLCPQLGRWIIRITPRKY